MEYESFHYLVPKLVVWGAKYCLDVFPMTQHDFFLFSFLLPPSSILSTKDFNVAKVCVSLVESVLFLLKV